MPDRLLGLHHVTAIANDPQHNLDFYAGILGLRLVKQTVNFDDPTVYHLYYGDATGAPGTIVTFFAWPGAHKGRLGTGQFAAISLTIPTVSLGYWIERLVAKGVPHEHPQRRFGELVLAFKDPDGLALELVASKTASEGAGWTMGEVAAEHAIRKIHSVALWEDDAAQTATFLTETLGFQAERDEENRQRLSIGEGEAQAFVDVVRASGFWEGSVAVGNIHHVAWRVADDPSQIAWRVHLSTRGHDVTPVRDRKYFRSIYFDEPGGARFELAADLLGFTVDEPRDELGARLMLPSWLEPERPALERSLPPIHPTTLRR